MAGTEFRALVGVELDVASVNALKTQIEAMVKPEVDVKLDVDTKGIQSKIKQAAKVTNPEKIKLDFDTKTFANQVDRVRNTFNKLPVSTQKAEQSVKNLNNAYRNLTTAMKAYNPNDASSVAKAVKEYDKYTMALKKAQNQVAMLKRNAVDPFAKMRLSNQIDDWMNNNTKAARAFRSEINRLQADLRKCGTASGLKNIEQQFKNLKTQAIATNKVGLTFVDRMKAQFSKYAAYMGISSAFMAISQSVRYMFNAVKEVDTAMTELKRVTDLSSSQYSDLYQDLTVSAREYGVALSDIISATADWSRAGFDANIAKGLAEVTTMYQHIADVDYDTAVENLLTAYKGFEGELTNMFGGDTVAAVGYIGDILNELDNNYAVTAAGVGEALQRSASALDVAGNSIQETAGMVTAITEVTQDPEKAGNALKVVSMRLRGKLLCLRTRKVCTLCFALNCKNIEDSYIRQSARVA